MSKSKTNGFKVCMTCGMRVHGLDSSFCFWHDWGIAERTKHLALTAMRQAIDFKGGAKHG